MRITGYGYEVDTYDEILQRVTNKIRRDIPSFDDSDINPLASMNKSVSDQLADMSLLGLEIYNSRAINTSTGHSLESLVAFLNISRNPPLRATGKITISGTDGTIVPSGTAVSYGQYIYLTIEDATITSGSVEVGVIARDGGTESNATLNTIDTIVNPIIGVNNVINDLHEMEGGKNEETDEELRYRYFETLDGIGKSTKNAVESKLLNDALVSRVNVIDNDSDAVLDGVPAHSFEAIVVGGKDDDIFNVIEDNKPLGIPPFGTEKKLDTNGNLISAFTRATEEKVSFSVDIVVSKNDVVSEVQSTIKTNLTDEINKLAVGGEITSSIILSALYGCSDFTIKSFTNLKFSTPTSGDKGLGDSIQLGSRSYATIDVDNDVIINMTTL